jgi:hypothetical protein
MSSVSPMRRKFSGCPSCAHDERIAAQIIAVEFDQVEGVEENAIIVVPVTDAVERRYPILAARDRLSVHDAVSDWPEHRARISRSETQSDWVGELSSLGTGLLQHLISRWGSWRMPAQA